MNQTTFTITPAVTPAASAAPDLTDEQLARLQMVINVLEIVRRVPVFADRHYAVYVDDDMARAMRAALPPDQSASTPPEHA